ncbi:hypothetical protein [Biformimicrobium ophioploci]|uniref:DUF4386 domain-containing protein n=1 Tax=Biformimicrobium ophioploci TaxID=3036711 RepID=A0ABQ6M321_9GAMM|nr:hypothetical protein [Microbulbifer sp. NKW57]GMG88749.1 hypothetical protein MNKW57_30700 [Microbulbifer sp. NKW57]
MDRYAGYTYAIASFLMLLVMVVSIDAIHSTELEWDIRVENLKANWLVAATIWRLEFICAIALGWASFHFAKNESSWYLVGIAHIIMAGLYAVMLGGYPQVMSEEGYRILYYVGQWIFAVSNFLWVFGMAFVISRFSGWFKYTGTILASVLSLAFLGIFLEILTFEDLAYAMPLLVLMYIFNGLVGVKNIRSPRDPEQDVEGELDTSP